MIETKLIQIEVAYALPDRQWLLALRVPQGTTLIEAVRQSGIATAVPGLDLEGLKFGIFGKARPMTQLLVAGDRVELYRPLTVNPKAARRRRAAAPR